MRRTTIPLLERPVSRPTISGLSDAQATRFLASLTKADRAISLADLLAAAEIVVDDRGLHIANHATGAAVLLALHAYQGT